MHESKVIPAVRSIQLRPNAFLRLQDPAHFFAEAPRSIVRPPKRWWPFRRGQKGQAILELALALPIGTALLLGGIDLIYMETQSSSIHFLANGGAVSQHDGHPACDYVQAGASGHHLLPARLNCEVIGNTVFVSYRSSGLVGWLPQTNLEANAAVAP